MCFNFLNGRMSSSSRGSSRGSSKGSTPSRQLSKMSLGTDSDLLPPTLRCVTYNFPDHYITLEQPVTQIIFLGTLKTPENLQPSPDRQGLLANLPSTILRSPSLRTKRKSRTVSSSCTISRWCLLGKGNISGATGLFTKEWFKSGKKKSPCLPKNSSTGSTMEARSCTRPNTFKTRRRGRGLWRWRRRWRRSRRGSSRSKTSGWWSGSQLVRSWQSGLLVGEVGACLRYDFNDFCESDGRS